MTHPDWAAYTGTHVAQAFLSPAIYPSNVSRVLILTRNLTSEKAKALKHAGATLVEIGSQVTPETLKGVDVLVNCLGHGVPAQERESLFKAALESGVKVYFPTEYGVWVWRGWIASETKLNRIMTVTTGPKEPNTRSGKESAITQKPSETQLEVESRWSRYSTAISWKMQSA